MRFDNLSAQAMQKSLDALWLRTKVINQNISNYETPGYKSQDVTFEDVLQGFDKNGKPQVAFRTRVTQDTSTSLRADGNNVNMEKEQAEMWRAQAQYSYLISKINGQYTNLRYVIKSALK